MRAERRAVWALRIATVLFWAALYVYVPYLTPYLDRLGMAASLVGYISGSYGAAMLIARIPIGIMADRLGRQKVFVLSGIALAAVSAVGMQLTPIPAFILLFRFLSGIAAATWVSFVTLYSGYFCEDAATQAVAALNMYASLGRVIASFLGAGAVAAMRERGAFLAGGGLGAAAILAGLFVRDGETRRSAAPVSVRQLLRVGRERWLLCASVLCAVNQMIAYATSYGFTNTLAQRIGAGEAELGILQAITAGAGVLAPLLLSMRFSRRVSERTVLIASFALLAVSQTLLPFCGSLLCLYAMQFAAGMGLGLGMTPLMALAIRYIPGEKRSTAMGYFQAVYSLGLTAGPVIMGYLVEFFGYTAAYCTIGGIAAITAAICCFVL